MTGGIVELDVHKMRAEEARQAIDGKLLMAGGSVYRIRVVHGYNGGTRIRSMILEEYGYGREPQVKRIEMGDNPGVTELVLREF